MSMLDDFKGHGAKRGVPPAQSFIEDLNFETLETDFIVEAQPSSPTADRPLFSLGLGTWERNVTRGLGQVVAVDCARDVVVVATSRNYVLRYNYLDLSSSFQSEVEIVRPAPDSTIQSIFLCPSTHHLIVNLQYSTNGFETHYVHSSWTKSKALAKLKGVNIATVGWGAPPPPEREPGAEERDLRFIEDPLQELATREILIGNLGRTLYSCTLDSRDRSGMTSFKRVFDFKDQVLEICGVAQQTLRDERIFVLIATNIALYVLAGGPTLEALFSVYNGNTPLEPFWDLPVPCSGSHLLLSWGMDGWPKRFAWMVDTGVYHGSLNLSNPITTESSDLVEKVHLWGLERAEETNKPIAMATTEFHFILMFEEYLLIVNRINGKVAQTLHYQSMARLSGKPISLATDSISRIVYLFTSDSLIDVGSKNEDKDVWKVYMDMQDFGSALSVCRTSAQRDEVYITQAEQSLASLANVKAARLYAKVTGPSPTFEEIALKFIELEDNDALQAYLSTKLEFLGIEDRAQKTMVASWLTELLLDKINRALMEERGEEGPDYYSYVQELHYFLATNVEILDVNTTVGLLAGYGRMDDLMYFAESRHDHEALLECLMQRGDVRKALGVMRLPSVSREIVYKFAPDLMAQAPDLAVDFWISQQSSLDPRRLLPALVSYGEQGSHPESWKHALRYIEFSINTLGCLDSALHNLAIALYSQDQNETLLVDFIKKSAEEAVGQLNFDGKYALRLIRERGRHRACVVMLCVLGMYEDAVNLALTMDLELAKSVAQSKELEDTQMKRKLWLAIARFIIQQEENENSDPEVTINKAVALLEEAGDLVKIEDILPFFPDFVTIDKFQGPIRSSLEEYNRRIDRLKIEMDEATDIADALRKDLKTLETRTAVVTHEQTCARCHALLIDPPLQKSIPTGGALPPFYIFPSGLAYHGACLCAEILELAGERKQVKITDLVTRLASVHEGDEMAPDVAGQPQVDVKTLQRQLDAEIAAECPRNGEIVVRLIDQPFIHPEVDRRAVHSWAITLHGRI